MVPRTRGCVIQIVAGILTQLVHRWLRTILGAIDRWTDPPIMRQRINAGTDKYFEWRDRHEGDSELDELFDPGNEMADDDD